MAVLQLIVCILLLRFAQQMYHDRWWRERIAWVKKLPPVEVVRISAPNKPQQNYPSRPRAHHSKNQGNSRLILFSFNPNTASENHFKRLGFKEWQIKNIIKFRQAGGVFRVKSDMKRLYGLSAARYLELEPFIDLPDQITSLKKESMLPINQLDSSHWFQSKLLPESLMKRIWKYKQRLGGFVSHDQWREIWGINDQQCNILKRLVHIDPEMVSKIKVNQCSARELAAHPYVDNRLAQRIVNYRSQHGSFTEIKEMSKSVLMPDSLIPKIAPYLSWDDH